MTEIVHKGKTYILVKAPEPDQSCDDCVFRGHNSNIGACARPNTKEFDACYKAEGDNIFHYQWREKGAIA